MLFTSLPFVLFLAATLLLYYIIPKKLQWGFLLVASYVFYALADLRYLIFIMTTTVTVWRRPRAEPGHTQNQGS